MRRLVRGSGRRLELVDFCRQDADDGAVFSLTRFQVLYARGQVFVAGEKFTDLDERTDDEDIHLDRAFAIEDGREHGHAVLGEYVRKKCDAHLDPWAWRFHFGMSNIQPPAW